MIKIAVIGIVAGLIVSKLRVINSDYVIYIILAATIIVISMTQDNIKYVLYSLKRYINYVNMDKGYLYILIKITGISYLSELSATICRETGCEALSQHIEMAAKLIIISMGLPVLNAILDLIEGLI